MEVTKELVQRLAHLSRLHFTEEELPQMQKDMEQIIGFVEKLNELDTTGVEPLMHMTDNVNMMREDRVAENLSREEALKNAAQKTEEFFLVPKVIQK